MSDEEEKDVYQVVKALNEKGIRIRNTHIEIYAAAYYQKTDLPPDEAELVEEFRPKSDGDGYQLVWYFQKKRPKTKRGRSKRDVKTKDSSA